VQTARFDARADLAAAIGRVERWYAVRGLPPCFQLTAASVPGGLDAALAARGYSLLTPTTVMIAPLVAIAPPGAPEIELCSDASPDVLAAILDPAWPEAVRRERRELFARIGPAHRFALARVGGRTASAGLCVADGPLAGLFAMRTQPAFRRRGLAAAVLARLVAWARSAAARHLYLQVEDDAEAALGLYRRVGLAPLYRYHYREKGRS
jgi:GNAT superfamily N-acetyltransferase